MNELTRLVKTYRLTAGLTERVHLAEEIFRLIEPDLRLFVFGSVPQQIIGAYNLATDFVLGDYGVDPVDGRVWAVVNHNSEFGAAVITQAVPEPSAFVLLGLATLALARRRRR